MCSSTLSVNCEYVEKWAHTVRPYGRVIRLTFSYFSKRSPVSGMRQVKKQKEVGVKRVETLVSTLLPRRGARRIPAESQRKTSRPSGANTLAQFEYPGQSVQGNDSFPIDTVGIPRYTYN